MQNILCYDYTMAHSNFRKQHWVPVDSWACKQNNYCIPILIQVLSLSDHNNKGPNTNNRTMEYGWRQNKDFVGGATC